MNSIDGDGQAGVNGYKKGKGITGKLGSFFSSKSSHISGFSLELDEPIKQYGPGDAVKGKVILNVARPLGVTHVTLCLYGYIQVFKPHSRPKPPTRSNENRVAKGRSRRWVSEYYGDGFASLFEEEIVLCGEGRLDPQTYHFHFVIDFPSQLDLPTSVDFERGTISYVISSTITRPGGIAPSINTIDAKVRYRDNIDVSRCPIPKPRIATLEPVDAVSRAKLKRLTSYGPENKRGSTWTEQSSRTGFSEASRENFDVPLTPSANSIHSDVSAADRNRKVSWDRTSAPVSNSARQNGDMRASKIITVRVEMPRGACLPGDIVPVQISVQHTKPVRSLNGIIVTLYRQGRVDMHPNLPIAQADGSTKLPYEDYYPRSRTGLGGLSLSAAGSSQVWRKDISQTFAPLFVDPQTLTATVKVPIRVSDELYQIPSIRNVPGEMISFKYLVEVIVDIHGKLGLTDRATSNLSTTALQSSNQMDRSGIVEDSRDHFVTAVGTACMDTTSIRRNKAAVTHVCDLLVGTSDSRKQSSVKDGKAAVRAPQSLSLKSSDEGPSQHYHQERYDDYYGDADSYQYYGNEYDYGYDHDYEYYYDSHYAHLNGYGYVPEANYEDPYYAGYQRNESVPAMPKGYDDPSISEKERQRLYETSIMPSRPEQGTGSSYHASTTPTAPTIPDNLSTHQHGASSAPPALIASSVNDFAIKSHSPQSLNANELFTDEAANGEDGLIPDAMQAPTDDKGELERRRLAQEASMPPEVDLAPDTLGPSCTIRPSAPPDSGLHTSVPSRAVGEDQPLVNDTRADDIPAEQLLQTPSNPESLPKYER